jgi:hypothetical protein
MATLYSDIFELFLGNIQDYKIDALYNDSTESAEEYMKIFLIRAIPWFDNCLKDLDSRNDITRTFTVTLNTDEKVILSNLMVIEWLEHEIHDIKQMQLHLQDREFKTYAESQNLKEKSDHLIKLRENTEKLMTRYGYKNYTWSEDS